MLEGLTDTSRLFSVTPTTTSTTLPKEQKEKKTDQSYVRCATVWPIEIAFADDTILQDVIALKAQIVFASCATRNRKSDVHWNLGYSLAILQLVVSIARERHYIL
jgi:hypothetical protein